MLKPVKQIVFYPIEFLFFASLWLLLTEFSWNQFLFAVIFSILDCAILVRLLIKPLSFKSFKALVFLIFYVIFDSIKSHFYIIRSLLKTKENRLSGPVFLEVTLNKKRTIALLAIILTLTPGTVWVAYNQNKGQICLYMFDKAFEETFKTTFYNIYIKLLKQ